MSRKCQKNASRTIVKERLEGLFHLFFRGFCPFLCEVRIADKLLLINQIALIRRFSDDAKW